MNTFTALAQRDRIRRKFINELSKAPQQYIGLSIEQHAELDRMRNEGLVKRARGSGLYSLAPAGVAFAERHKKALK